MKYLTNVMNVIVLNISMAEFDGCLFVTQQGYNGNKLTCPCIHFILATVK